MIVLISQKTDDDEYIVADMMGSDDNNPYARYLDSYPAKYFDDGVQKVIVRAFNDIDDYNADNPIRIKEWERVIETTPIIDKIPVTIEDPQISQNIDKSELSPREKLQKKRSDEIKLEWRHFIGKDDDDEINDYHTVYSDDLFKHFCSLRGYMYSKDKELLLKNWD